MCYEMELELDAAANVLRSSFSARNYNTKYNMTKYKVTIRTL